MPSQRTFLIGLVLVLAIGVAAAAFAGCTTIRINETDVFLPKPSITPASFTNERVQLTEYSVPSDTVDLDAWYFEQPGARGTVLFFGGNGFYLVQSKGYVEALTSFPLNVLMFDYRGYGNSGGEPAVQAFKKDASRMYSFAVDSLKVNPQRLIVHGHSLGTFMATHTAQNHPVSGVVLENPATNVEDWIDGLAPWFVRLFIDFEIAESLRGESNLNVVQDLSVPLLLLAGEEDQVTRPEMARSLYEEAMSTQKNLVIVDSMGHNRLYVDDRYTSAYQDFLDAVLSDSLADVTSPMP
ncbi:alpha/beta hydrolase [Longibacter salinarum]|uniref:Alpha/beta hydrolase n=1 Tax=Longibacter salinarum TaxID=1850348 RepID=A0A2A8D2H5_9BACT|nr:alpha/beta fold hydrolase [Longibacter salinarum]PEN15013.1 alpha/beta hydrolase [Longibacter salinarum]